MKKRQKTARKSPIGDSFPSVRKASLMEVSLYLHDSNLDAET